MDFPNRKMVDCLEKITLQATAVVVSLLLFSVLFTPLIMFISKDYYCINDSIVHLIAL